MGVIKGEEFEPTEGSRRALAVSFRLSKANDTGGMRMNGRPLLHTQLLLLLGWTGYIPVAAKHATVPRPGPHPVAALFALIKVLAGLFRHGEQRCVAAGGAAEGRLEDNHVCIVARGCSELGLP